MKTYIVRTEQSTFRNYEVDAESSSAAERLVKERTRSKHKRMLTEMTYQPRVIRVSLAEQKPEDTE